MKKYIVFFSLFLFGCSTQLATHNDTSSISDLTKAISKESQVIESKDPNAQPTEGYYIWHNYLWHDDKKLIEDTVTNYIDMPDEPDRGLWYSADVFWEREEDGKTFLYLKIGRECAPCNNFVGKFLEIDQVDNSVKVRTLENLHNRPQNQISLHSSILSHDKSKLAFVVMDGGGDWLSQSVWVYDILQDKLTLIQDIPDDRSVLAEGFAAPIHKKALYWDENDDLIINPVPREEDGSLPWTTD